jgi:Putative zinc-finger
MQHPTIESLIGFAEGRLSPESKLDVEQHIATCAVCSSGAPEWFSILDPLKVPNLEIAPAQLEELFATGFCDHTASVRVGQRGVADCRQVVFRAADVDVHLRIGGTPRVILGQMFRRKASHFLAAVPVGLSQNDQLIEASITDMLGEFRFSIVPAGTLRIHADLPSYRLIVDLTIDEDELN